MNYFDVHDQQQHADDAQPDAQPENHRQYATVSASCPGSGSGSGSPLSPTYANIQSAGGAVTSGNRPRSPSHVTVYQTTGPDTHAAATSPGGLNPALNPRSCVTCRRRKVRCDKQMPCSNCRRARTSCVFPAPGRAPRQQRPKDPNAPPKRSSQRELELIKRLQKLEGIVEELSGQIDVEAATNRLAHSESPRAQVGGDSGSGSSSLGQYPSSLEFFGRASSQGGRKAYLNLLPSKDICQQFGRMVLGDHKGTARYVSSGFWSKMNDEIDAIRVETQRLTDDDDASDYDESPVETPETLNTHNDHHAFILGYRSADVDLAQLHPLPSHAALFWSVFQENVEPLIKILHVPTVDAVMREARSRTAVLSPANEALVFAIYFSAVTAIEQEEVQATLRADKFALLAQYRFAVEQALAKANFLSTSDITVLQAFTLFLLVARRHDGSRFCWSVTSLIVRLAQGMGLHRDGSHFGLSPFETEMRRRLWWAIVSLDLRSGEELGTDMVIPDGGYDTQLPLNINDADISPDSKEAPESRQGRSDCAVAVVRFEICSMTRRIHCASSAMASQSDKSSIAEKEQLLMKVYQRIEDKFLRHVVDEMDPLYWVVAMITRVIMAKTCLVIYHPLLFPGAEEQLSNEVRQRLFVAAIEIIEYNHKLSTDVRCKQYRWLFKTYTAWHAISYVLVETCRRPWTPLVERAWHAVTGCEGDPVELAKKADHAAVFIPLRKLFARARRHRVTEITKLRANLEEARRLDFAERMDPEPARFSLVPGAEHLMEQARERWRLLVKADGSGSGAGSSPWPSPFVTRSISAAERQEEAVHTAPPLSNLKATADSGPTMTGSMVSTNAVNYGMNFADALMPQQGVAPVTTGFWEFNGIEANVSSPLDGQPPSLQAPVLDGLQQACKDGTAQPLLWGADPFSTAGFKLEDVLGDDAEMGDDFNWQDWSHSIRGLEMGDGNWALATATATANATTEPEF